MAEKLEKSIPWFAISAICILVVFGTGIVLNEIVADVAQPTVTVGNVAPTVGTVILNGGSVITINENATVTVVGTTTITDNNGFGDISSVTSSLYVNSTTCGNGLEDANWCYLDWMTCATHTCSGLACVASCTVDVWFIAEPTDASGTYPAQAWQMDITAVDTGNNTSTGTTSQELNAAAYINITASTTYLCSGGACSPGATSSPEVENTATNTGNHPVNVEISGVDMDSTATSIDVGQQKYSTDSSMGDWVGTILTVSATEFDVDLSKPNATPSNATDSIYWMIKIPTSTDPGTYSGTNTIDAIWTATSS